MNETDTIINESPKIIATLANLFNREGMVAEYEVLSKGKCAVELTGFDNWNGGTDIYGIFCKIPIDLYSQHELQIEKIEQNVKNKAEKIFRSYAGWLGEVVISPELSEIMTGQSFAIRDADLLTALEMQKTLMISVATNGAKIQTVNDDYKSRVIFIGEGLSERNIRNNNPFTDLWQWYGKWSDGTLPTYQSRREFVINMYEPVIDAAKKNQIVSINPVFEEPTGWVRVDRGIGEFKHRLIQAKTEEQFQAIGLLCRETLISLAQVVYVEKEHPTIDGVVPSKTDAKRMLEAYLGAMLSGQSNETTRKHAKASLDLANDLTHRRTAEFRMAAMCAEATNVVVNIIAIISGRRDPR
jgi:hypothetical protein